MLPRLAAWAYGRPTLRSPARVVGYGLTVCSVTRRDADAVSRTLLHWLYEGERASWCGAGYNPQGVCGRCRRGATGAARRRAAYAFVRPQALRPHVGLLKNDGGRERLAIGADTDQGGVVVSRRLRGADSDAAVLGVGLSAGRPSGLRARELSARLVIACHNGLGVGAPADPAVGRIGLSSSDGRRGVPASAACRPSTLALPSSRLVLPGLRRRAVRRARASSANLSRRPQAGRATR